MPLHILLCDTADEVARLQYQLLRVGADTAVDTATDAFGAIQEAARRRPDVIVCDIAIEGTDGPELVRRLRAASPGSRVVAWTEERDPEQVARTLESGAAGYLLKDDDPTDVLRAAHALYDGGVIVSAAVAHVLGDEMSRAFSDARAARAELVRVKDGVSRGSSSKADFLANISHELRTPVTVAKGIAHVLGNPAVSDGERREFLSQLQGSLDKLTGLIEEIITVAELERGTFQLNKGETDMTELVHHAIDEVHLHYPHVEVDAQIADRLIAVVDGVRIGSVVRELLDNACRYSPPEQPVEVRARMLDEGVVVQITDHGEGLDRAVASRSFDEPFTTGEGILRKEKAGMGVGLHLARQLIVEHGGILWTDPLPGGGTRASFCIPADGGETFADVPATGTGF
jgi:signal transduction histidine kinase